jgi:hypothetical protein
MEQTRQRLATLNNDGWIVCGLAVGSFIVALFNTHSSYKRSTETLKKEKLLSIAYDENYRKTSVTTASHSLGRHRCIGFDPVEIDRAGRLSILPPRSKAGDTITLRAEMDLTVGLTACSAEISNNYKFKPIGFETLEPCAMTPASVKNRLRSLRSEMYKKV